MVQAFGGKAVVGEDVVDFLLLQMTDFDGDKAIRLKQGAQGTGKLPKSLEAVPAAIQADGRIVCTHFRCKCRDLGGRDVRGVGNDDIEPSCQGLSPVPGDESGSVRETQASGIGRCNRAGRRRDVDSDPPGSWQFVEQGKKQAAASGAYIENPGCPRKRFFPVQDRFDQGLAVRARIEGGRSDHEIKPPEFPPPDDSGNRFAPSAPGDQQFEAPESVG